MHAWTLSPSSMRGVPFYADATVALDFANSRYRNGLGAPVYADPSLVSGWSYSRTGTEYEATSSGLLVPFGSGVPAITDLGLGVWEARTNLVLQSNSLSNATWNNNSNITFGTAGTFVDGTQTFALLTASSTNACRAEIAAITIVSGTTYTFSAYFKAGNANGFIRWKTTSTQQQFKLNLSSGATTAGPSNSGNTATVALTLVSAGIWRATLTVVADATSVNPAVGIWDGTADQFGYPGATSGTTVYAGGAQIEAGAFAGLYIPTTSASATRGAASASVGGLSLPASGTLIVEAYGTAQTGSQPRLVGNSTSPAALLYFDVSGGAIGTYNGTAALTKAAAITSGSLFRAGVAWTPSTRLVTAQGLTPASDANAIGSFTALQIGSDQVSGNFWDQSIRRVVLYPTAMSSAQLQALTQ